MKFILQTKIHNLFIDTPLRWSKFNPTFTQTLHFAGVSKITKT